MSGLILVTYERLISSLHKAATQEAAAHAPYNHNTLQPLENSLFDVWKLDEFVNQ